MNLEQATVVLGGWDGAGLDEARRLARAGRKVVLVVQASPDRGDDDLRRAEALGPLGDPFARAVVLNASAVEAAAVASRRLVEAGVSVALLDPRRAAPVTDGHPLDARPRHVNARWFERTFAKADVIVAPGGVGIDDLRRATNLGADGAELTAVFLASTMALPLVVPGARPAGLEGRKARLLARDRGVEVLLGRPQWSLRGAFSALTDQAVPA